MLTFLTALAFVFLAEMGDKTQLVAMAFATRFHWRTVLAGVLAATLINHLLAVLAGNYLTHLVPGDYIKIAASAAFILFGLWTLRGDTLGDEAKGTGQSPFWTVSIAFFLAEMGDKTQLATLALAAEFQLLVPVWLGTTAGMITADGMGIGIGIVMGKKLPERLVKWTAAAIFIAFGVFGLYQAFMG